MNNHWRVASWYYLILFIRWGHAITFDQNGYADIIVKISDSMTEQNVMKIKNTFEEASTLLHKTTNKKAYFGQITFLFPNKNYFPVNLDVKNASWETLEKPAFIVTALVDDVSTRQNAFCGEINNGVMLPTKLIEDDLGPRKIVRNWVKYRYGIFDETPLVLETDACYYESNRWKLTGCYNEDHKESLQVFSQEDGTVKCPDISANDLFKEINLTSSLMFSESLITIEHFCDNHPYLHNIYAPTKQNFYCEGKSVFSVIKNSFDFDGVVSTIAITPTNFQYVTIQPPRIMLVIQNTVTKNRQAIITNVLEFFNAFIFDVETEIGVISFGETLTINREISYIKPTAKLLGNLRWEKPITTCPFCALVRATKEFDASDRTNIIVLIGDATVLTTIYGGWNTKKNIKLLLLPFMSESQADDYDILTTKVESPGDLYPLVEIENEPIVTRERFYFSLMDILNRLWGNRNMLLVHKSQSALNDRKIMEETFATLGHLDGKLVFEVFCDIQPHYFEAYLNDKYLGNKDLAGSSIFVKQLWDAGNNNEIWNYNVTTRMETHCAAFAIVVGKSSFEQSTLQTSYQRIKTEINGNSEEYIIANADLVKANPGTTVTAHLVDQKNNEHVINLKDNGLDPDLINDDGLYTNYLASSTNNVPDYYFIYLSCNTVSDDSPTVPVHVVQMEYLGFLRLGTAYSTHPRRINNLKLASLRRTSKEITLTWTESELQKDSFNESLIEVKYSERFEDLGEKEFENAEILRIKRTSTGNESNEALEITVVCDLPEEEDGKYYVAVRTSYYGNRISRVSNRIRIIGGNSSSTLKPTPTSAITFETTTSSSEEPVTQIPNNCSTVIIRIPDNGLKEGLSKTTMIIIIGGSLFAFFLLAISANFLICWCFVKKTRKPSNTSELTGHDNPSTQSTLRVTDTQNHLVFDGHSPNQRDFARDDGTTVAENPIYMSPANYNHYFNRQNNRSNYSMDMGRV